MQHLSEEALVEHYYHDDAAPSAAEQHLRVCAACRGQYETLRRILALVSEAPVPERGDTYGTEVWNRLRWKMGSAGRRRRAWTQVAAAAAVVVVAFLAGQYWEMRNKAKAPVHLANASTPQIQPATNGQPAPGTNDRVLLLVVSDHLDSSERVLLELANADPKKELDVRAQQARATELVEFNRIYRQTATQRGEARIASVLSDLEPVLVELSNGGGTLSSEELAELQKRIDAKGLLFKVRVVSAQAGGEEKRPAVPQFNSNSL